MRRQQHRGDAEHDTGGERRVEASGRVGEGTGRLSMAGSRYARPVFLGLLLVTLLGAGLRLTSAGAIGIYRDEGQALAIMQRESPKAIIAYLQAHESHPPGYYLLGHGLQALGLSLERTLRWLSMAASIALVPLVGWVVLRLAGAAPALISAGITALAPGLFLYSVQVRPYALITLLVFSATALLARFLQTGARPLLIGWALCMVAAISMHHAVNLYLAAQAVLLLAALWRHPSRATRLRDFALAGVALVALVAPLWLLLLRQMSVAGYDAWRPFSLTLPALHMLRLVADYPLEYGSILLFGPVAGVLAWRCRRRRESMPDALFVGLVALTYVVLSFLASYRSRVTLPHVMMTAGPLVAVLVAAAIAGIYQRGGRVRAALLVELLVILAGLSWISRLGYFKTNADLVAEAVMATAAPPDLLILMPGHLGASMNRTLDHTVAQVDYPYMSPRAEYPFDRYFDRMADTSAWHGTLGAANRSLEAGGSVYLAILAGYHLDSVRAELALPADSFASVGQADIIRAAQLQSRLEGLAGAPDTLLPWYASPQGFETLNLLRYHRRAERFSSTGR